MSCINLFMSMGDFVPYVKDILIKNNAKIFIRKTDKENNTEYFNINLEKEKLSIEHNRQRYSNFYITSTEFDKSKDCFYKQPISFYSVEITGGRVTDTQLEIIELRLLSRTPDKSILKIFNAIQYRLKNDKGIGKGVRINTSVYKKIYYEKKYLDNKIFSFEFGRAEPFDIKPLEE